MKIATVIVIAVLILGTLGSFYYLNSKRNLEKSPPTSSLNPPEAKDEDLTIFVSNLEIPWEIEFLPDKTFFITERKGIVWQFNADGSSKKKVLELKDVAHIGEGGLLGIVNHPQHERNALTYVYYTYNQGRKNKVIRYKHIGDSLIQDRVILDNIPGSRNHNGGRIKFGPDGKLYITTGDSENPSTAQDTKSLAGKILRLNDDGSIPSDNPFGNAVYSYGHRNPQGLAWDTNGQLWSTEHGQSAQDEVNLINKGNNYGWPDIRGDQTKEGMNQPYVHSSTDTWAPSGAIVSKYGILYFAGLRGSAIYSLAVKPDIKLITNNEKPKELFKNKYGRLRSIVKGPDGFFYLITNNKDGRGNPKEGDDKIIKVSPKAFE